MKLVHKKKGFEIEIVSKRGTPVVSKKGMVVVKGSYMSCESVCIDVIERDFKGKGLHHGK